MNRLIIRHTSTLFLIALLSIALCGFSLAESIAPVWLVKPTKPTGWVNLRSEPSLDSEGLARATLDQEVIMIGDYGDWAQVIFDGQPGYMKKEFLQETNATAEYFVSTIEDTASQTVRVTTNGFEMRLYTDAPNPKSTVKIEYPYFTGNTPLNTMIAEKIQDILKYPSSYYPQFGFTADYTTTVTLNNSKMVSMVFLGNVQIEKGRPGTVVGTLNVDLSSMKELRLTDLYTVSKEFEDAFFQHAYFPSEPISLYDESQFSEQMSYQTRSYKADGAFHAMYEVQCFLTPGGIVISLPETGDNHLEAQLNYSDIDQFYRPSNRYWEN